MKNNNLPKKVIFIGSSSYSGSTMLDMMLSNSHEGFSVGEVNALFQPYRPHHFNPECGCGNPDCDFWQRVRLEGEEFLYQTIFSMLPETKFIVDSSKSPWWIKKQSQVSMQQGYEVYNLLLWKDPAAFAHSVLKRKQKGWEKLWKNYYRLYFSIIANWLPVSYEKIVQEPAESLKGLCNKIGLPYHDQQEFFWAKQHHTLFGNDSAKVHLSSDKDNNSHKKSDILSGNDITSKHRSIYHDLSYLDALPVDVKEKIKKDPVIKEIMSLLDGNAKDSTGAIQTISFTPLQILLSKIRWHIRLILGRTIGRHWLIF